MAAEEADELQSEAPPPKRARFDNESESAMDDIYGVATDAPSDATVAVPDTETDIPIPLENSNRTMGAIPGLGLLGQPQLKTADVAEDVSYHNSVSPADNSQKSPQLPSNEVKAPSPGGSDEQHLSNPIDEDSPMVTAALEALLGAQMPSAIMTDSPMTNPEALPINSEHEEPSLEHQNENTTLVDTAMEDVELGEIPVVTPTLTSAEEVSNAEEAIRLAQMTDVNPENVDTEQAEFEVDSSPYESSSEDSSDESSSSDDDDDEDDAYKLLSPEEQARILMEGDGGSDDEGGGKGAKGPGQQLRTKNEVPEEIVPKPDVTITAEMKITELGYVEHIVESSALIKAKVSGEYKVLETGAVLCLEDRSVIGVVADTLGRVQQPLYSVRFTNSEEIAKAGLKIGTRIFYSEQHSTYVFTQALKAYKGSDASNLHDEEVGDEEIEFSDDEKEAEHKKRLKQKRLERRGGGSNSRGQRNGDGSSRGGHPLQQQHAPYDPSVGLSYDDQDDGPYRPLARPAGFAQSVGQTEAPQEGAYPSHQNSYPRELYGLGRGRGDRGDRSDRGRGRGREGAERGRPSNRGQGRGRGGQDRRDDGFTQRPYENRNQGYSQPPQGSPMALNFASNPAYNQAAAVQQYSPQQPFAPAFPPGQYFPPQTYQQSYGQVPSVWPPTASPAPTGAFINPAFFRNQQQPGGQPMWAPPPPPQMPQSAEAQKAFNDAQERLNILRNLGAGRGPGS